MGFREAIFDVDGVLVDSHHERAWWDTLRQLMDTDWRNIRAQTTYSPERFTPKVYQEGMAGKLRLGGATAALAHFKVPDAANRAEAYGERKQRVVELIEAGEFLAFPDALRFALAVKFTGLKLAAASSSKNADLFLKRIPLDVFVAERGFAVRLHSRRNDLAEPVRRGHLRPRLRARQAPPYDLSDGTAGAWLSARALFRGRGRLLRDAGGQGGRDGRLGVARLNEAGADLVVTSLDDVAMNTLRESRLDRATIR